MPKVFYVQPDGVERGVEGAVGDSVMATAVKNGVRGIIGQCGGTLSCATCHVYLDESELELYPEMDEMEDEMLDCAAADRESNSRLSCQLELRDGVDLHVVVPPVQQ
jgi:2Fe-2S ferredoxin